MKLLRLLFVSVVVFCTASPALAHRINIFAVDEGGDVYTESTFAGKRPVIEGVVRVYDTGGALLLSGTTDAKGVFTFDRPEPGALIVEVDAGMGHKNRWNLEAAEGEADARPGETMASPSRILDVEREGLTDAQWKRLEQTVHGAVEKAFLQSKEERRVQDIVGGIGYIVGLFGVVAWVKSRRRTS